MTSPLALPLGLTLPPVFLTFFAIAYTRLAPKFKSERQRAYILSSISSCTMTTLSLPFVYTYLTGGIERTFDAAQMGEGSPEGRSWLGLISEVAVVFFGTYLFADLAVGQLKYPSQVGLVTGWIHHVVYIGIMGYLLHAKISPMFLIGCIMELPTFDLAISNLFPIVRDDLRFLVSFFTIRIVFHAVFLIDCVRPSSRALMGGSWIPTVLLTLAGTLHVLWFKGGVAGYLKRRASKAHEASQPETQQKGARADSAWIANPRVYSSTTLATIAEVAGDETVQEILPVPTTPEDSPLVTPRTPGQTPFQFPSIPMPQMPILPSLSDLPAMSMPKAMAMPNIPTMSIPSFSEFTSALKTEKLRGGGSAFKDAVKSRWDERRGRFEGNMGMEVGYGQPRMQGSRRD